MAFNKFTLASFAAAAIVAIVLLDQPTGSTADPAANPLADPGHGHGHHKGAGGTACIVKGSYCSCHYCKCEKGWVHCGHKHGYGKKYCYGSMEGQYCHCDYCKCKHGYGSKGYGKCH